MADEKKGPVGDEAVLRATGRDWNAWGKVLDKDGAKKMQHGQIAALLSEKYGVGSWWCQMVTVGYERSRGLRAVNQKADGFSAGISRVVHAPLGELNSAFKDPKRRKKWLGTAKLTVRTATENKSMRITWEDATNVEVYFTGRGEGKSHVAIQHSKLAAKADVARQKAFWSEALAKLKDHLEA